MSRLSGGLTGRVAEGGLSLSQGERLRIAMARALLREPSVLLLDEPDANLDLQAVRVLHRLIAAFGGTVILATHRSSTIERCDIRWHLQDGQLIQSYLRQEQVRQTDDVDMSGRPAVGRSHSVAGV